MSDAATLAYLVAHWDLRRHDQPVQPLGQESDTLPHDAGEHECGGES